MHINFSELSARDASKLLLATVTPRPIALVTTLSTNGLRNAAPFSFFNAMSSSPPILALGFENRGPGAVKDTATNIRETGEYIVHLVDEALAPAMNAMATDFGPEVDELSAVGVDTIEATIVAAPLIAEAPVAFECRSRQWIDLGDGRGVELGDVVSIYLRDGLMNEEKRYVDTAALKLVGRMQNPGWYARTTDLFQLRRMSVDGFEAAKDGPGWPMPEPAPEPERSSKPATN